MPLHEVCTVEHHHLMFRWSWGCPSQGQCGVEYVHDEVVVDVVVIGDIGVHKVCGYVEPWLYTRRTPHWVSPLPRRWWGQLRLFSLISRHQHPHPHGCHHHHHHHHHPNQHHNFHHHHNLQCSRVINWLWQSRRWVFRLSTWSRGSYFVKIIISSRSSVINPPQLNLISSLNPIFFLKCRSVSH